MYFSVSVNTMAGDKFVDVDGNLHEKWPGNHKMSKEQLMDFVDKFTSMESGAVLRVLKVG